MRDEKKESRGEDVKTPKVKKPTPPTNNPNPAAPVQLVRVGNILVPAHLAAKAQELYKQSNR